MTNPSSNLRTGKKRTEGFEGEAALYDDNTSVRQQRGAAAGIENVGYTTGEAYLNQKVKILCSESENNVKDRKVKKSKKKKSKTKKRSSKEKSQIDDVAIGNDKGPNEDSEIDQINISLQPQHYVENDIEKEEKSESLKRTESNKISDVHHQKGFARHQYVTESSSKISKLRMKKESIEKLRESFRSQISSLELRSKEGISFSSQNSSVTAASTDPMASTGECSNSMGTHDALDELDETSDRKRTIVTHVPGIKRSFLCTAENSMEYQRKSFDVCSSSSATCSQDMTVLAANISDRSSYFGESNVPYFGRKEETSRPVKIREMSSPTNRPSDQQKYISKNAQQPTKQADNQLFADHSLSFLSPKSIKNCSSSPLCDKIRVEEGGESYGTSGRVSLIKEKGLKNITKSPVVKPCAERYDADVSIQKQKLAVGSVAESYDGATRIERREMLTNGKTRLPLKSDLAENAADLSIRDSLICNPPGAYAIGGPIVSEETEIKEQRVTSSEDFAARNSSVPDSRVEEHLLIEAKLVTEFPKQDEMQNHFSGQKSDRNIGSENAQRDTFPVLTDPIVLAHAKKVTPYCSKRRAIVLCVVIFGASIIGILTFIICKTQNKQSEAIPPVIPMIQRIKQNGFLRCSVIEAELADDYSKLKGVENKESVVCRAIAAALFGGDGSKVEIVETPLKTRFQDLSTGRVDVGLNSLVQTMDRTLHIDNENIQSGLVFSSPYFYYSTSFGGDPKFVSCAEEGFTKLDEECNDLKLCVLSGTRIPALLDPFIPQTNLIGCTNWNDLFDSFVEGRCNVVVAPEVRILLMRVKNSAYSRNITNITVSKTVFQPEPVGIVTRNDDPEWSDFCQWVVQALMTISDNSKFKQTDVFGEEFSSMFQDIHSEIGNWNDFFDGFVNADITPKAGLNSVNNGTTGLIRSLPLGFTDIVGPEPVIGGTIRDIIERGYIRCALRIDRRGFAERISFNQTIKKYKGMDVDYCRAVAASIFGSGAEHATVEWKEATNSTHAFGLLNEGAVDLVAGVMVNLERDVRESSTGVGFSFTNPYFFNNSGLDNIAEESWEGNDLNLCLVTRQDDVQWSNYVYWIVECTFFAEENYISSSIANDMPQVRLFGEGLQRMFRDAILAVGNYGDIYEENVGSIIPRARRNLLNPNSKPGPQLYALPGVLA